MSWQAVKAVLEESTSRGSARLVLLVIAEASGPDGTGCRRGKPSIAVRAGLSRATVTEAIGVLAASGELAVEGRRGLANRYHVVLPSLGTSTTAIGDPATRLAAPRLPVWPTTRLPVQPRTVSEPSSQPAIRLVEMVEGEQMELSPQRAPAVVEWLTDRDARLRDPISDDQTG